MRIETVVIDDNRTDIDRILQLLKNIELRTDVLFHTEYMTNPVDLVSFNKQMYIIDIDLGKQSGFSVAERIKDNHPNAYILFCTSHDDLVFNSFNTDVFFFIRKDHLEEDLIHAIRKFIKDVNRKAYLYRYNGEIVSVPYAEIMYFEINVNELYLHTVTKKEYKERKSVKQLLTELPKDQFVQPSSHFVVNCAFIDSIDNKKMILKDGNIIQIVKGRYRDVEEAYLRYLAWR